MLEICQFDVDKYRTFPHRINGAHIYTTACLLSPNPRIFGYFEDVLFIRKKDTDSGSELLYVSEKYKDFSFWDEVNKNGKELANFAFKEEDLDFFKKHYFTVLL